MTPARQGFVSGEPGAMMLFVDFRNGNMIINIQLYIVRVYS
jgi:hypothetical protein